MIAIVAVACLLGSPQEAAAQGSCSPHTVREEWIPHNNSAIYKAEAEEMTNCVDWGVSTFSWLAGAPTGYVACAQGTLAGTTCQDIGEQVKSTTVIMSLGLCGPWLAEAYHYKIDHGSTVFPEMSHKQKYVGPGAACVPPWIITDPDPACAEEWEGVWDYTGPEPVCFYSPILVPLSTKQNIKLTSIEDGVLFDMDGDGQVERVAWTVADSRFGFLFIDKNGNGIADNGTELIGNFTVAGSTNGFDALLKLNNELGGTQTAFIEEGQPLYPLLKLWDDRNHDGVSTPGEVVAASTVLSQIGLGYRFSAKEDKHGNRFAFEGFGFVRTGHGKNYTSNQKEQQERTVVLYDVFFAGRPSGRQ